MLIKKLMLKLDEIFVIYKYRVIDLYAEVGKHY